MKHARSVGRTMIAVSALAIISAPTAFAEPPLTAVPASTTPSATAPTSTTPLTRTASAQPDTSTTTATPSPTTVADSARQTTTRPATTTQASVGPTPTSAGVATTSAAPTISADPGELRVDTGTFAVTGPVQVGGVVPGTIDVTVTDTRPDSTGWTADVKVTDAQGTHGNTFSPAAGSFYRARNTQCSESAGQVSLGAGTVVVATASTACPAATWTSDIGIAVPADASPDDYTITVTHSVY